MAPTGRAKPESRSIGFGPGDEEWAHMIDEHISLEEVVRATEWYALLPKQIT